MNNEKAERIVMMVLHIILMILVCSLLTIGFVTFMDSLLGIERDPTFIDRILKE